jgi:Ala-tRNA(Pro) deacylase
MPVKKLKDFLDRENVKYVSIYHSIAYTSQEIAASVHVKGREMAKTVMVKLDGKLAMAVLPASHQVDFEHLKRASGAQDAVLATEKEFKDLFPGCDIGAMPPIGNLYGMEVFVAQPLTEDKEIAFNAGSHYELIRLAYKDFERVVNPKIADFSVKMKS